ncbi:MAG: hypothetical protein JOZ43_02895 [Acidobacteriales bacterium]|nr:hypothetical protein [Terriglobales bacterium]
MRIPNFRRSLLAVLVGSVIYFWLQPYLPGQFQHMHTYDFGLVVWFAICALLYWCFGMITRHHGHAPQ